MRILVFAGNEIHARSAYVTLPDDADITIVTTHDEAYKTIISSSPPYDVIMIDMMMRTGAIGPYKAEKFAGQEMPHGVMLALLAARRGNKRIAVLVEVAGEYKDPFLASLGGTERMDDPWGSRRAHLYRIDGAILGFLPNFQARCWSHEHCICYGTDWGRALKEIMESPE